MGLFKKKAVPSELPDLALDDLESGSKEVHEHLKKEEQVATLPQTSDIKKSETPASEAKEEVKTEVSKSPAENSAPVKTEEVKPVVSAPIISAEAKPAPAEGNVVLTENEKSFFSDLQNSLNEEISDFSQFESWYKDKFEGRDVIKDMKDYWENKKTESIIKILGKNFQEKISLKISKLQELEKNWQTSYFDLVEKEEEIKEQELELKELLGEFVKICKKKTNEAKSSDVKVQLKSSVKNTGTQNAKTKKTN